MTSEGASLPPETPVARLENVALIAGDGSRELARLTCALTPGSAHVVVGPPGSGKSRLIALLGLEAWPSAGRLQIFGRDVATLSPRDLPGWRRRIGRVYATDRLLEHLSVFDNVALVPRLAGRERADYEGDVAELLAWMDLASEADARPAGLGGAGRRRVALARAMANRPDLLLVDDPGAGLDERETTGVLKRLSQLNAAGTTILMAIGDEALAEKTGAAILRLADGALRPGNFPARTAAS